MLKNKKILVTGGAGFIGSNLIDKIIDRCLELRVVDDFSSGSELNIKKHFKNRKLRLIRGDVINEELMMAATKNVDIIYHLAAFMEHDTCAVNCPVDDLRGNVETTISVLNAAVRNNVKKFIYTSSVAVYGQAKYLPQDENHPLNPNWPYGCSKLAAEKYVRTYHEVYNLNTVILRPALVYGPNEWYGRVMSIFIKRASEGRSPIIFGDGEQTRDFVHVKDIVDQLITMVEVDGIDGEVFNGGSNEQTSINNLANLIIKEIGKADELNILYQNPPYGKDGRKPAELVHLHCDMKKSKNLLNFSPSITISEGIKSQIDWFNNNSEQWK